jgi:hypothetical protein
VPRALLLLVVFIGVIGLNLLVEGAIHAGLAQQTFTLHGRVADREGKAVAGADVALYTTPDVRRPVDFLSPPTIENGSYAIALPPGTYWAVARQRQGGRFGPLRPTDRHSGMPVEIVGTAGEMVTADFTIATVRELGEMQQPSTEETVRLKARLVDQEGKPAANAYLFARKEQQARGDGIPDFISPSADQNGEATLILPPGKYFIGAELVFPPRQGSTLREMTLAPDSKDHLLELEVSR